jgi:hypothetical protein
MYQTLPYSNLSPNVWGSLPTQNIPGFGYQSGLSQSLPYAASGISQSQGLSPYQQSQGLSPYQGPTSGAQQGYGAQSYLSPESFIGSLRGGQTQSSLAGTTDTIFVAELGRSARGLQEISDQIEGRDPDSQRRGLFAATAHLFYVFGLLSSKGVFIPGDLPGKTRTETGGPANATREFGKQLERFVEKIASGRGPIEELSMIVERGKICFTEITRAIEGGEAPTQETRKKAA